MAPLQSRQEVFHVLRCIVGIDVVKDQQPTIFVFKSAEHRCHPHLFFLCLLLRQTERLDERR
jgi:hypothetical protein